MKNKTLWLVIGVVVIVGIVLAVTLGNSKSNNTNSTNSVAKSSAPSTTVNNSVVITKTNSSLGSYLTDPNDKTLYTIGSGTTGVNGCTGSCLQAWPPYVDTGSTSNLPTNISTITRSDNGDIQYEYKGKPLYYFSSDSAGQITGQGVSGFSVATP